MIPASWRRFLLPLEERITRVESNAARMDTATVTEVLGSACTVSWRGTDDIPAACLASYTPSVGDTVAVLYQHGQLLVLGRHIGAP